MKEPIPSVIYARVSPTTHIKTEDDIHQSIQESLLMCRRAAEAEGNPIITEYIDQYKTGKSIEFMGNFKKMMDDARAGKFKRIYCRRVNRFGRNRADMITAEIELSKLGISIKFVESGIDTAAPMGKSIMAIMSELAEMDRNEIVENTSRGREKALYEYRNNIPRPGKKPWGHPKKDVNVKSIRQLRLMPVKERPTWKQLSKDYNMSVSLLIQRLKDAGYWDEQKRCVK
jgi:DNA invertase Pin-like site-specific DNA recombinase